MKKQQRTGNKTNEYKIEIFKSLTVNNISEFKNEVDKYLADYNSIKIYGKNVEVIDVAGLQLLFTIKKWAIENQKKIEFDITVNPEIAELHKISGLNNILKTN
jgi:hypothetical protein